MDSTMTFIDHITYTASSCMTSLGKNEREEHCSDKQTLIFNSLGFRKLKYFTYPLSSATKLKLEDPGCSIFAAFKNFLGAKRYYLITPILKEHDNQFYILGKLFKNVRMEWPRVKQRIGFSKSQKNMNFLEMVIVQTIV